MYGAIKTDTLQLHTPHDWLCIDRSFLSHPERYDFGTYGWRYNAQDQAYRLHAHTDLLHATRDLDNETVVGAVDLVAPEQNQMAMIEDEPDHYGIFTEREVVGSLVVRMGDVRRLGQIEPYYYEPLSV